MKNRIIFPLINMLFFYFCTNAFSAKVVVIPLNVQNNLSNIVTVAKSGGDFSSPAAAINSINDAAVDNEYLVFMAPGDYAISEPIIMKEYVSLQGSGSALTKLDGKVCSSERANSAVIIAAPNSQVKDLLIINKGPGDHCTGIYAEDVGINSVFRDFEILAVDGSTNRGIDLVNSSVNMENGIINSSGSVNATGIFSEASRFNLSEVNIRILGFANANGIFFDPLATSNGFNVTRSVVSGSSDAIRSVNGSIFITYSELNGGVNLDAGTANCLFTHDGFFILTSNCLFPL